LGTIRALPDDDDYEWLSWLMNHPEEWTDKDLSSARSLISNQTDAIETMHPKDLKRRASAQRVVDGLEAAIDAYLRRQP
jgi:hypothetical protein